MYKKNGLFRRMASCRITKWVAIFTIIPLFIFLIAIEEVDCISMIIVLMWLLIFSEIIIFATNRSDIVGCTKISKIILWNLYRSGINYVIAFFITSIVSKIDLLHVMLPFETMLIEKVGYGGVILLCIAWYAVPFIVTSALVFKILVKISIFFCNRYN